LARSDGLNSEFRGVIAKLGVTPFTVLRFLLLNILALQALNLASVLAKYYYDGRYYRLTEYFDVGVEHNIPTIYSTTQLIFAGFCSICVFKVLRVINLRDQYYWCTLGVVLIFLGFDEGATIHEAVGGLFNNRFESGGYLYWLWVVPYGVLTAWFAAAYFPFLMRLPNKTRLGLVLSGAIFVGGAIGVEMISAAEYEAAKAAGVRSLKYYLLYSLEEFMEMFGIALFIYYVLDYLASLTPSIELKLRSDT
jgi:hypothetical protein